MFHENLPILTPYNETFVEKISPQYCYRSDYIFLNLLLFSLSHFPLWKVYKCVIRSVVETVSLQPQTVRRPTNHLMPLTIHISGTSHCQNPAVIKYQILWQFHFTTSCKIVKRFNTFFNCQIN